MLHLKSSHDCEITSSNLEVLQEKVLQESSTCLFNLVGKQWEAEETNQNESF